MSGGFNLDEYVDVAERIQLFYAKYPDGRLATITPMQLLHIGERTFVWCQAAAYRAPDDQQPCVGTAWEPIPGPTPYTRDSEAMNAETAAWGRAIIAAGIPSKRIASRQEVAARQGNGDSREPSGPEGSITEAQMKLIATLIRGLDQINEPVPEGLADWTQYARRWMHQQFGKRSRKQLEKDEASKLIDELKKHEIPFA